MRARPRTTSGMDSSGFGAVSVPLPFVARGGSVVVPDPPLTLAFSRDPRPSICLNRLSAVLTTDNRPNSRLQRGYGLSLEPRVSTPAFD